MNWLVRPAWVNPGWSWWRWIRHAANYWGMALRCALADFIGYETPGLTSRYPPWGKCAPRWPIGGMIIGVDPAEPGSDKSVLHFSAPQDPTVYPGLVHITEIADWPPDTGLPTTTLADLGITTVEHPDGSWTYYDKDGREVGCGFSVPKGTEL
jgi:hypothetical protein